MQSNPMQRKTRNAFLLGMFIMLLLAVVVVLALYFGFLKDELSLGSGDEAKVQVYRLLGDIKSGTPISEASIELVTVPASEAPTNYYTEALTDQDMVKIDLTKGTILTTSLLYTTDEDVNEATLRLAEFNMISLPSSLRVGDYVDIRLTIPSGQDFIVLSKKRVMTLQETTLGLYLTEEEITTINCAIIESYIMTASNMYAIQYIEPGMQEKATQTYPVNSAVYSLIQSNSNILAEAKNALTKRLNDGGTKIRNNYINSDLSQYSANETENIESKLQEQIETARELYLSGMSGY